MSEYRLFTKFLLLCYIIHFRSILYSGSIPSVRFAECPAANRYFAGPRSTSWGHWGAALAMTGFSWPSDGPRGAERGCEEGRGADTELSHHGVVR